MLPTGSIRFPSRSWMSVAGMGVSYAWFGPIWEKSSASISTAIFYRRPRGSGLLELYHSAHRLDEVPIRFAAAFANCSLEHMDQLDEVLESIRGRLQPGGAFLLSVVTDKFMEWNPLPSLFEIVGQEGLARSLQADYRNYHHLVNVFSSSRWAGGLDKAGFEVLEHTPIIPELTSRLFSFADHLWHIREKENELGSRIGSYLAQFPKFSEGFRLLLEGVLKMERDWALGSGAVFWARRRR